MNGAAFVDLALLFFVLLGSKIVLGAVAVYLLLPRDPTCELCDSEMLPLLHPRGTGRLLRLLRLQRRWCMECQREAITRSLPSHVAGHAPALPVAEPRVR